MANFTFLNATATISTTEYSLAFNAAYSAGTPKTTQGYVFAVVDAAAMTASEIYRLRIYERANAGTQRVVFEATLTGAQAQSYVTPVMLLGDGWDVTFLKVAGTDRSILFSVRLDTNDVNAATITNGAIAAATFAAGAITSTVLAAGAITSSVLASGAITAATFAASAITSTVMAAGAITSTVIASGAIAASQIANGAITSLKFSTDAIDSTALATSAVTEIVNAVFAFALEAAPTNATTFAQRLNVWWSILSGKASGLTIGTASSESFRDAADTKNRATFTLALAGTRTPGTFDGT